MNLDTRELTKHKAMILEPMDWPRWPHLPLKNPDRYHVKHIGQGAPPQADASHGIIFAVEGYYSQDGTKPIYLFHTNMFTIPTKARENPATKKEFKVIDFGALLAGSHEIFQDADAVLDAGWMVD